MLHSPSVVVICGAENAKKYEGTLDWKQKSVQRYNIVSNLASDLVNSDVKRRIIQKIRRL